MDLEEKRHILFARAGGLITAMYALLFARLRMIQCERPEISYGPMSIWDEERQRNLNLIYNYNDIEENQEVVTPPPCMQATKYRFCMSTF